MLGAVETLMLRLRLGGQQATDAGLRTTARHVTNVGTAADRAGAASNRAFRGMSGGMSRVVRGAVGLVGAAGGVYAFGRAFHYAWEEQDEARRVGGQTLAVIRSTGGAANVTARHVSRLAQSISDYAGIDDEAIQGGENLLLTFRRVRNEAGKSNKVFDQATRLAVDMGVALGTDARSGAMMLGKALDNPAQGYSRLMRSGVSFSQQQIKRIRNLQREGDLLGAQKIILREVAREFDGSARAQVQATDKLRVAFGNVAESAGSLFMPAVDEVVPYATRLARRMQRAIDDEDMSFGEKARFIWRATRKDLDPAIDDIQRWLERSDVKQRIEDGIETWTPRIIDATANSMAKAGPRAAGAFIHGFSELGPWGRLLTVGFLMTKMNAWGPAGRLTAGLFTRAWSGAARKSPVWGTTGSMIGRSVGTKVAAETATGTAAQLPASMDARRGRFAGLGRSLGGMVGRAGGIAAGAALVQGIAEALAEATNQGADVRRRERSWGLGGNPGLSGGTGIPDIDQFFDDLGQGVGQSARGILGFASGGVVPRGSQVQLVGERGPELVSLPGGTRVTPSDRTTQMLRELAGRPGDRRTARRDLHIHQYLDGRAIARSTLRNIDDDDQWGRD